MISARRYSRKELNVTKIAISYLSKNMLIFKRKLEDQISKTIVTDYIWGGDIRWRVVKFFCGQRQNLKLPTKQGVNLHSF